MFCPNCGSKLNDGDLFCPNCGTPVMHTEKPLPEFTRTTIENTRNEQTAKNETSKAEMAQKSKRSKILVFAGVAILSFLILHFLTHGGYNSEYSNNDGDKLPIIVTNIHIAEGSYPGESTATFSVKNLENTDYKFAEFAVLAWNHDGLPMKLDQPWVFSSADMEHEYVEFFEGENIQAETSQSYQCKFDFDISEIQYISVFLVYYEDFTSKTWDNPIADHWEEIEGHKLEDTDIYFFEFE